MDKWVSYYSSIVPLQILIPNSLVPHCANRSACGADRYAFHMTFLSGNLSTPYNYRTDNRYKIDAAPSESFLCNVKVKRLGNPRSSYTASVYDWTGAQKGPTTNEHLARTGQNFSITGLPAALRVTETGPFSTSGSGMHFDYMSTPAFSWDSDNTGSSRQVSSGGNYCSLSSTGAYEQDLVCYFPCFSS